MANDYRNYTDPPYYIGIVNNNPGNIRPGESWVGAVGSNHNFVVFKDVSYGCRALAVDLSNKIKNGYNTIAEIINRYAPPSENDTQAYINAVASSMGLNQDEVIPYDMDHLSELMRAIIDHEQGDQAYLITDDDIQQGIQIMPQSFLDKLKDFFVNNPVVSVAAGYGAIVVIVVIVILVIAVFAKKKIKLPYAG